MSGFRLPSLEYPERYAGLYVFDFGGQVAVGYTAEEIAVLLESERYRQGRVYRIHRACPDGTMELVGVPAATFQKEDGLFFYRGELEPAREDFVTLAALAGRCPPPCRMKLHLARLPGASHAFVTAIIFPAEYTHEVSTWLLESDYAGGDFVEGGTSQASGYYEAGPVIVERRQLWPAASRSRSPEEVLASVDQPVQRRFA